MTLEKLPFALTVCKPAGLASVPLESEFFFLARTDEELSLVCRTEDAPEDAVEREDGWRAFRIAGVLDFSLVGILSKISGILVGEGIGIFTVSTYNTDYILVREEDFDRALNALEARGYDVL